MTGVDVVVVGAGPAGLVAGITLARYGAQVLMLEKRDRISTLSRALVISTRSMELLRAWGLEAEVRAGANDVEPCGWRTETLACGQGAVVPLGFPTVAEAAAISPTRPAWAPQDQLEPILHRHLRSLPTATDRFGHECTGLTQDGDTVRVTVCRRGSGTTDDIEARYVVAADGAHSVVRRGLGITMEGSDDLGDYHRVEFRAPLAPLTAGHRYGLNLITHPDASGVLAPRGLGDRWGFSRECPPGQTGLAELPEADLVRLITTAVGDPTVQPRIERVSRFTFAAQIATRYRDRRCFLVGDAAHRTTPRGGTGMNTAIHDAHNLGWKLGWVLNGWASPALLDTYETERRPVGLHNVGRSGDPGGAQRDPSDALPWDLNGRIAHRWIRCGGRTTSTLDLIGDGITVLTTTTAGPPAVPSGITAPMTVHHLDDSDLRALGVPATGLLVRPDGRQLCTPDSESRAAAALRPDIRYT